MTADTATIYVLLVDDDRDDFFLTEDLLKQVEGTNYRLVWAGSCERADTELKERSFDVVLVDYHIGEKNGLDFIREKTASLTMCPIILITGVRDAEVDHAAQLAGAADYLTKDCLTPELLDRSIRYARGQSQRHSLLHTVIANTSTGIIALDARQVPVVWNMTATRALGLDDVVLTAADSPIVAAAMMRAFAGSAVPSEIKSGSEVFEVKVSDAGRGSQVIAFHNVTKRAEAERLLRQSIVDAEAANAAKSLFLASMSHELRTPLNGILGMTGLLEMSTTDRVARDHLEVIKSSANDLLHMISSLLDLSKIEAGKMEIETVDFDLTPVVESVITLLSANARLKGLDVACYVDPRLPRLIAGDPHRLKQIITNLVGNAIKFTDHGGVSVFARIERNGLKRCVKFSVVDTGPGIPKAKLGALFRRFSQVDTGRNRRHDGTGLGLALCKELLDLMGGSIWCESVESEGSSFHFTLPIADADAAVEAAVEQQLSRLRGRHVLALGCNGATSAALAAYCAAVGWELCAALDIAACDAERQFDVIVVDGAGFDGDASALISGLRQRLTNVTGVIHLLQLQAAESDKRADGICVVGAPLMPRGFAMLCAGINQLVAARTSETVRAAPPRTGGGRSRLRVLLAEDNPSNRKLTTMMLNAGGYALQCAEDGELAVKACEECDFDVLLMDLHMPRCDGLEATRRIRAIAGYEHVPIIGLTASALSEDRDACLGAGMTVHMPKPVDWDALIRLLKSIETEAAAWPDASTAGQAA